MYRRIQRIISMFEQSLIEEDEKGERVVKKYSGFPGSLKWRILYINPAGIYYPITGDPLERLLREEKFFTDPPQGVPVPKVYSVDYKRKVMVREHIKGRPLEVVPDEARLLGQILGRIHSQGYKLGDTRPENFIVDDNKKIIVIDAEQAVSSESEIYRAWDFLLTVLFIYLEILASPTTIFAENIEEYVKGYSGETRPPDWSSLKSILPLIILIPYPHRRILEKTIIRYA